MMKSWLSLLLASSLAALALAGDCDEHRFDTNTYCAILFDDDGCEGWNQPIEVGYTELGLLKKNDAEAVKVRAGCKFVGYDHNDEKRVSKRGKSVTIDATRDETDRSHDFSGGEELDDEISSVDCTCRPGVIPKPRPSTGNSGENCKGVQFRDNAACIVYDDEDCRLDNWSEALSYRDGESKSFSILKSPFNVKYKNQIESVSVKAGCVLALYDDSDFQDDETLIEAPEDKDRHDTLSKNLFTRSMDEDAESLRCYCPKD